MAINYNEKTQEFHLYNDEISYVFTILKNNQLGQLYFGKRIRHRESFSHMLQLRGCVLAPHTFKDDLNFSLEVIKQEYPAYGTGDYRSPAYQLTMENGSRITNYEYKSHEIYKGKKELQGLPATYGEKSDVTTLSIRMFDDQIHSDMIISYHIFEEHPVITRDIKFVNKGSEKLVIERAMSTSMDFYDSDFEMVQLDGAWSRERHVNKRKLQNGIQSVGSRRGGSSASHNPFIALKREETTENQGEVYGFSLVYSGNFLAQAEVDDYDVTRVLLGIHPFEFEWTLLEGQSFQTPEAVMVYSDKGLNGMSQAFHNLFKEHLIRGYWKDKVRPVLINNWEATYFDFTEDSILEIAEKSKDLGIKLFVLDDGWFGKRNNDHTSLGDWHVDYTKLPNGIEGIAQKITDKGLRFGLWFEPEMINEISDLYKEHEDWIIGDPGRKRTYGRNQFVLDFSNKDVVDYLFEKMSDILKSSNISYIKWDMNRNITEAFSAKLPANRQKEFFHRYILGVYDLYDRLNAAFPYILFESCASGGARFDPGMLYYAPQTWTSDDTDAVERLKIQYGTSMVYPLSSIGSHVSAIPNHQVSRETPLKMRADVAYFGTFGYELDVTKLTPEEEHIVSEQIKFFKKNRELIQQGNFYRLENSEDGRYSWMVISKDQKTAILASYKVWATPNPPLKKVLLQGLNSELNYHCEQRGLNFYGDELMHFGFLNEVEFTGLLQDNFEGEYNPGTDKGDFSSYVYTFEAK